MNFKKRKEEYVRQEEKEGENCESFTCRDNILLIDAELTSEAGIFLGSICYGEKGKEAKDEGYQLLHS